MKYGIAVVCAALAAAGAGRAESDTKAAFAADEKAVGKVAADWSDAWNRHDAEGMASLFSERGDLINPIGDVAKGRPQILRPVNPRASSTRTPRRSTATPPSRASLVRSRPPCSTGT